MGRTKQIGVLVLSKHILPKQLCNPRNIVVRTNIIHYVDNNICKFPSLQQGYFCVCQIQTELMCVNVCGFHMRLRILGFFVIHLVKQKNIYIYITIVLL